MKKTKIITAQNYGSIMIHIEPYSVIKDILYNGTTNIVSLIYEYDDILLEKNKAVEIMIRNQQFDEPTYRYTYWGTSIEYKATLSTTANNNGYGSNMTNISLNVMNDVIYNYIFYNEIKPLEETRDLIINDIIG
jgi:hypothetical protein